MEKKNTLLLSVIAVATLLVAVVGATFAYFAGTTSNSANIAINAQIANGSDSVFSAVSSGSIALEITAAQMTESGAGDANTTVANSTPVNGANATVSYTTSASTTCTYNLVYTADTTNGNTYEVSTNAGSLNEFVLEVTKYTATGTTPSSYTIDTTWETSGVKVIKYANSQTLFSDTITTSGGTTKNNQYQVRAIFYNLNLDQAKQLGKKYLGYITVSTPTCVAAS